MCVAQGRWIEIYGSGPERSANSMNRDRLGKRKLFFHSWWQRGKPFFHTEKIRRCKKEERKLFT
jgi:hypothetical protein